MPLLAASALVPLITGGIGAGASVYGSHAQGSAQAKAQAAQAKASEEALAFQKQSAADALAAEKEASDRAYKLQIDQRNYDREAQRLAREDYLKRQSPYIQLGDSAFGRLSQLLHVQTAPQSFSGGSPAPQAAPMGAAPARMPVTSGPPVQPPGGALASVAQPSVQAGIGAGTQAQGAVGIRMVAPTGEVGMVPPDQVARAEAAGARRLQ